MSKDPAFLFYPGDASEDTQFMNRLERGAYFDLVKCQRIFGGFTMAQLRKVLGSDFEAVKDALLAIMKIDGEQYFIPWVRESIQRRQEYSKKQSDRAKERWNKEESHGTPTAKPQKENGNVIVIRNIIEYLNEKAKSNYLPTTANTIKHITARLNEGRTEEDFKKVIDTKVSEWLGTERAQYLRPETLFGSKFEGYLNQQAIVNIKPPKELSAIEKLKLGVE